MLVFKNIELESKLEEKGTKTNILIDNLQTILSSFHTTENSDLVKNEKNNSEDTLPVRTNKNKNESDQIQEDLGNSIGDAVNHQNENFSSLGTKQKLYSCQKCSKLFKFKNELLKHSKVHKLNFFQETCDQCEYKANNKDMLDRHVESVHERFLYECNQCDKKFNSTDNLKTHFEKYHKENIFKCEECDAKFKNSSDIRKHKQAHLSESFCHTFNNFPKCQYGSSCIFLHSKAPFCSYDGRCIRPSCQYRHRYGCLEKNKFCNSNFMNRKRFNNNKGNGRQEDRRNEGVKENNV